MKRRLLIVLALFLVSFTAYLFLDFVRGFQSYMVSKEDADTIVVLTGGTGRTEEGLRLLRSGASGSLILSGVNEDADLKSIFLNVVLSDEERRSIILEKNSQSTFENAVEVKRIMDERGLGSMILITSVYHMQRAYYIFSEVFPDNVRIVAYPVSTPNFNEKRWWSGAGIWITATEFLKYYWYYILFSIKSLSL